MAEQKIYGAIIKVMQEVEPIAKGRTNTQQNYKFRGVDELMNAISPILSKHAIFPTAYHVEDIANDSVTSKNGGQGWRVVRRYTFRFYAEDGSFVDTIADGEAIDYGDKASNKAQSVAYREAMFKMFVIPFQGEDIENQSHDIVKPAPANVQPPKSVEQSTLVKKKRILDLCNAIAIVPLRDAVDYAQYVNENTGLTLEPHNYSTIIERLEALKPHVSE